MRLLAVLLLLVLHVAYGWSASAFARRQGSPRAWWAWVPALNLLLPFALAGRSLAWGLLLLLPPANVIAWVLAWSEALARAGRHPWWGVAMAVPGPNLVVPARAAGEPPRAIAACLGVVVAVLAAATLGGRRFEAQEARRVVAELTAALTDPSAEVRREAARGLHRLGERGAPAAAPLLALVAVEPDASVRGAAARALLEVAPAAEAPATDALVAGLLDAARGSGERDMPDVELVDALARAGAPAVPALQAGLRDADAGVRWHAAAALMQLGPQAAGTAPALLLAMDDSVWVVRNAAGRALEDVAQPEDVPALVRALADPSAETRYHAARAIGRVGAGAAAAVPALAAALKDEDWEVRSEAIRALSEVGPAARPAVPGVADALQRDAEPQVRAAAAWALASLQAGGPAPDALRRALADPELDVRRAARAAMAWMQRRQVRAE